MSRAQPLSEHESMVRMANRLAALVAVSLAPRGRIPVRTVDTSDVDADWRAVSRQSARGSRSRGCAARPDRPCTRDYQVGV